MQSIQTTSERVQHIAAIAEETAANVEQVTNVTHHQKEAMIEINRRAKQLERDANELRQIVERFDFQQ